MKDAAVYRYRVNRRQAKLGHLELRYSIQDGLNINQIPDVAQLSVSDPIFAMIAMSCEKAGKFEQSLMYNSRMDLLRGSSTNHNLAIESSHAMQRSMIWR